MFAKNFWPEACLSNIMIPEMQGDEHVLPLKMIQKTSHIPVLFTHCFWEERAEYIGWASYWR